MGEQSGDKRGEDRVVFLPSTSPSLRLLTPGQKPSMLVKERPTIMNPPRQPWPAP